MFMLRPRSLVVAFLAVVLGFSSLHAADLRLKLPKRSKYTPVQKLNRDGVGAVEKHQYDKARKLFYQAYLIDPNDPFTLNNLGYLAELEGETDRAQKFYQLAAEMGSDAIVDRASNDAYEGKAVSTVAGNAEDKGIKINRLNSDAIALLNKDRAPEADLILQRALALDGKNPFTLNNLGYAKEKQGELEAAQQFYTAAANTNSNERVEIAINPSWRGRPIQEVAASNADKLRRRLGEDSSLEDRVARLNLRGISAMNRNDRRTGRQLIEQAYKLNPEDPFTLNNMGYLAEMDGDRETADHYYDRARRAEGSGERIAMATRRSAVGRPIGEVAAVTDQQVLARIQSTQAARQREGGPVVLRRRDNSLVPEPDKPLYRPQVRVSDADGNLILPPRPSVDSSVPSQGGGLAMPLPDDQQPTTVREGQQNDGGLIMPLPENQQPGAAQNPATPQPAQQQPAIAAPSTVQPSPSVRQPPPPQPRTPQAPATQPQTVAPRTQPQTQTAPEQNQVPQGGLLLPLPDDQQPPEARSPNSQPKNQTPPPQNQPPRSQIPQSQNPPQAHLAPEAASTGVFTPASTPTTISEATTAPTTVVPANPPASAASPTARPASLAKPKKINDNDPRPKTKDVKKISDRD